MTDSSISEPVSMVRPQSRVYLEKDIFFESRMGELMSATSTVALNFRESILLRLLLVGRVKKQAVMDAAWGDNGIVVTEASYHQLVRSLRKKFEEIGLPAQSIKTLPRFGLEYLREQPATGCDALSAAVEEAALKECACVIKPVLSATGSSRGMKWTLRLLLLILPLLMGIFIGHIVYRNGQAQIRTVASGFGVHIFDRDRVQSDGMLLRHIKSRRSHDEYVYKSRNGLEAWLGACSVPGHENF